MKKLLKSKKSWIVPALWLATAAVSVVGIFKLTKPQEATQIIPGLSITPLTIILIILGLLFIMRIFGARSRPPVVIVNRRI